MRNVPCRLLKHLCVVARWAVLTLTLVLTACLGIDDLSRRHYQKGIIDMEALSKETVAILPMMASGGRSVYLLRAESILMKSLVEMRPQMHFIPPGIGLSKIREGGHYPLLLSFERESLNNKVIREEDLQVLRKILNARFLLQIELQQVDIIEGATQVSLRGRLWDVEMGKIIWEATGESRGDSFLFLPRVPVSFEWAIETASRGLVRRLP